MNNFRCKYMSTRGVHIPIGTVFGDLGSRSFGLQVDAAINEDLCELRDELVGPQLTGGIGNCADATLRQAELLLCFLPRKNLISQLRDMLRNCVCGSFCSFEASVIVKCINGFALANVAFQVVLLRYGNKSRGMSTFESGHD